MGIFIAVFFFLITYSKVQYSANGSRGQLPEKLNSLTTQSASVVVVVLVSDHFSFKKT
jgi:hypothetical protein